jgi:Tol biopolymer transport system component
MLYFVQRTQSSALHFIDQQGNRIDTPLYHATFIRAAADGSRVTRLLTSDAFGFGYPSISSDGRTLVFSSVDNMTALAQHLCAGGSYTNAVLQQFGPRVRVVRYTVGGQPATIALNAGRPELQP